MTSVDRLLLRVTEAARLCSVSRSHLYSEIQRGNVPVVRLGGAVRIPRCWLEQRIESELVAWQKARPQGGGEVEDD